MIVLFFFVCSYSGFVPEGELFALLVKSCVKTVRLVKDILSNYKKNKYKREGLAKKLIEGVGRS